MSSRGPRQPLGLWRLLQLLAALRRPFLGSARGATFIEYLVLCGVVALGAILAFKRLREKSDNQVKEQAQVVLTLGGTTPKPGTVLFPGPGSGSLFGPGVLPGPEPGKVRLPVIQPQCFAAGTPVATENGALAIEAVRAGERVWARDESTGEERLARVLRTYVTRDAVVIGVDVPFDVGRSERLRVTPDHPFWVQNRGWIAASELNGAPLLTHQPRPLRSAPFAPAPLASALESRSERATVYNLEVEGAHTYFVGRAQVLVHNTCGVVVKTYDQWRADPNRPPNTQVNHLNQDKVYGTSNPNGKGRIPKGKGASVPMTGSTTEPGTEHYKFHRSLEDFWDRYRGKPEEEWPTNAEYGAAVERALIDAGFSEADAKRIAADARASRIDYGYEDGQKVPRIPGSFM